MKKILAAVVLGAVVLSAALYLRQRDSRTGDSASYAHTGTVEAVEVIVSFQVPGNVSGVTFGEGETIDRGQILATLDTVSLAQEVSRAEAALATAVSRLATSRAKVAYLERSVEAQISGAQANLLKLTTGLRPQEVERARLDVERAVAEADRAESEGARVKRLYDDGVVPLARRENTKAAARVARANLLSARKALEIAELGARKEEVEVARSALEAARARTDEVEAARLEVKALENEVKLREAEVRLTVTRLDHATLTAPLAGVALTRAIEPGENVPAGRPVTTIADLSQVKVRFYVPEEELGRVKLDGPVSIVMDSFPDRRFPGRVSYISPKAEFTPKTILTREERTKLVYMIKVLAPNPEGALKPGMPVDVLLEP